MIRQKTSVCLVADVIEADARRRRDNNDSERTGGGASTVHEDHRTTDTYRDEEYHKILSSFTKWYEPTSEDSEETFKNLRRSIDNAKLLSRHHRNAATRPTDEI